MSYLDTPRFHFGGSFFAGPNTINNIMRNFNHITDLGWNPNGVALCFLRGCQVYSMVDAAAQAYVAADPPEGYLTSSDPFLSATVNSQNPYSDFGTAFEDVPFSIPKIVDLDPNQQGRSAVFGMYLLFQFGDDTANSPGFYGRLTVPEIRNMGLRANSGVGGSYKFGCTWQGSLQDLVWIGDVASSPFLADLKARIESGGEYSGNLSVKLNVDLHRNMPNYQTTDYDMFCYGRCMGSVGPELVGEPSGFVPARMLYSPSGTGNAPFKVQDLCGTPHLSLDLSGAVMLDIAQQISPTTGEVSYQGFGALSTPSGYVVGTQQGDTFTALTHGELSFEGTDRLANNLWKRTICQCNSGVFSIPLTAEEAEALRPGSDNPLAVSLQLNQAGFLAESSDGMYIDVDQLVSRLEQGIDPENPPPGNWYQLIGPCQIAFSVLRFGAPLCHADFDLQLSAQSLDYQKTRDGIMKLTAGPADINLDYPKVTDANGVIVVTFNVKDQVMTLSELRALLLSRINLINSNLLIGDGATPCSVLVWKAWTTPHPVTWADVEPVLSQYATLYPGMKDKLDISDQSLVTGSFKQAMLDRLGAHPCAPDFMPVTRDLTPSRIDMIVQYLDTV